MKILLTLIFSLVFFNGIFAQPIEILDSSNQKPIPYANIIYMNNGEISGGTYSNKNGIAHLSLNEEMDSVEISCLGYFSKKLSVENLGSKIYLEEKEEVLGEVVVLPHSDEETKYVGIQKEKNSVSLSATKGYQMVVLIDNPIQEEKQVKSFTFHLKKRRKNKSFKVKLIFFKNNDGKPSTKINKELVIGMKSLAAKENEINLDSLQLTLPKEGLFVGLEWLGCMDVPESVDIYNQPKNCRLAIMCNIRENSKISNPVYTGNIFQRLGWQEQKSAHTKLIPVFGLNVYE